MFQMGIRGEIYSNKVLLPNRTYFFNVKENRMGDLYLNIVESKNKDTGGFDRQSVVLFADDLSDFLKGFEESLRIMEKAAREKKRTEGTKRKPDRPDRGENAARGDHAGREDRTGRGEHAARGDRTDRPRSGAEPKPRVVKKTGEVPAKPAVRKPRTVRTFRREEGKTED